DFFLATPTIDDHGGLALQSTRRILLRDPFESWHASRASDRVHDRHRSPASDVEKVEKVIPEVAFVANFATFVIEDGVKWERKRRRHGASFRQAARVRFSDYGAAERRQEGEKVYGPEYLQ